MKNAIKYYYNLDLDSIHQKDKVYSFNCKNDSYIFINYDDQDVNEEYEISNYLLMNNIRTNQIVLNNFNQLVTNINNNNYVLIKIIIPLKKISIEDILNFNININNKNKLSWFDLWIKKVDYMEYQMNQQGLKYKVLRESFSYYIGLAENAIMLSKEGGSNYFTLAHKRISYNDNTYQLYNPLNYTVDHYYRDICEYFKSAFFNNVDVLPNVKQYLDTLNQEDKRMFFARLLFPTYYFDYYEKIIDNELEEKEINKILSKVDQYELFLKEIYYYLGNALPEIDWLKKVILY